VQSKEPWWQRSAVAQLAPGVQLGGASASASTTTSEPPTSTTLVSAPASSVVDVGDPPPPHAHEKKTRTATVGSPKDERIADPATAALRRKSRSDLET
jgi:hypothetical protein